MTNSKICHKQRRPLHIFTATKHNHNHNHNRSNPGWLRQCYSFSLKSISTGIVSKVVVVTYDASSRKAAQEFVTCIRQQHNMKSQDIVVANAGILKLCGPAASVSPYEILEHFEINTLAPLLLYQATKPLLNASVTLPKLFVTYCVLGSNALMDTFPRPLVAYETSKAAVDFIAGNIHTEKEEMVVVPVQRDWFQTAMGETAAEFIGMTKDDVPVILEDRVSGLMTVFDSATKEEFSGSSYDQNIQVLPW